MLITDNCILNALKRDVNDVFDLIETFIRGELAPCVFEPKP